MGWSRRLTLNIWPLMNMWLLENSCFTGCPVCLSVQEGVVMCISGHWTYHFTSQQEGDSVCSVYLSISLAVSVCLAALHHYFTSYICTSAPLIIMLISAAHGLPSWLKWLQESAIMLRLVKNNTVARWWRLLSFIEYLVVLEHWNIRCVHNRI